MKYSKELINKFIIISITVIAIIATIFCAIYFIHKAQNAETYSPIENFAITNKSENIEKLVVVLSSSNDIEENSVNEVNNNVTNTNTNSNTTSNNTHITIHTPTYYIKVNYGANVVTIYTKDSNGKYTVPIKAMICSTGTATPTSGVYKMDYKYRWLSLFGNVYGQYCSRIVGNILFHSVPYLEKGNPASLEYWEYDKLGTSASAGCIRLKVEDAMWIYNNCPSGTMVEFYSSSNPGPLGKPSAPKISGYSSPYRDWDPTDPSSSNPWQTNPPSKNNTTELENKTENNVANNITNSTVNNAVDSNSSIENNTTNNVIENIIDNSIGNNIVTTNNIISNYNNIINKSTVYENCTFIVVYLNKKSSS